jgi:hypothetical protein
MLYALAICVTMAGLLLAVFGVYPVSRPRDANGGRDTRMHRPRGDPRRVI